MMNIPIARVAESRTRYARWSMLRRLMGGLAVALIVAQPVAALQQGGAADAPWIARGQRGMVATDSAEASEIGARVLAQGGNAFDAAIAVSFALSVARPQSTGLGGGGFLVAWLADEQRPIAIDFRETAPAAATPDRYAKLARDAGAGPSPSVYGGAAVGVPGQLAGLEWIHEKHGTLKWSALVTPAIDLAERGFVVDQHLRDAVDDLVRDAQRWPQIRAAHGPLFARFAPDGAAPEVGRRLPRPDLARGLRLIAERGAGAMREGPLAEAVLVAVNRAGGVMTPDDLRGYRVRGRDPLRVRYRGFELVTMPPPSSGGICAAITLRALESSSAVDQLARDDAREMLARVEAMKHGFADRARWLGDPDFAEIPTALLLAQDYGDAVKAALAAGRPLAPDAYGTTEIAGAAGGVAGDDGGTSHFCIVDAAGNVVSMTETINGGFGSLIVAEPFGLILNNELDDFLTVPGSANMFGLRQSTANLIAPGKRPLSSMTPTIVLRDGRPILALGGSGGPRIISSTLHVLLNVLDDEMPLEAAIERGRPHHQWSPDEVYFDRAPSAGLRAAFTQFGYRLSDARRTGVVQAIQIRPDGERVGASDPRKGGRPVAAE